MIAASTAIRRDAMPTPRHHVSVGEVDGSKGSGSDSTRPRLEPAACTADMVCDSNM